MRQHRQPQHYILRGSIQADVSQIITPHAGEQGYGDEFGFFRRYRFACSREHFSSAQRVHVYHPYAQTRRRFTRIRHCIGDVVKFQIKEHLKAFSHQLFYQLRPGSSEQLLAHFHPAQGGIKPGCERQCRFRNGKIECDDDFWIV